MNLTFILPAINHLLSQQPWAQAQLAVHAGKVACIDAELLTLRLLVRPDGLLAQAAHETAASVTIKVRPADIPLLLQNRDRAFSMVRLEGDADLAHTLSQLSQSLRWDAEADVSKLVGDVPAVRLVGGAKALWQGIDSARQQFEQNVAEYLLEENPMLVRAGSVTELGGQVMKIRDGVERLMKRIEKLEGWR